MRENYDLWVAKYHKLQPWAFNNWQCNAPFQNKWNYIFNKLGVKCSVTFLGWVPHSKTLCDHKTHDFFFLSSYVDHLFILSPLIELCIVLGLWNVHLTNVFSSWWYHELPYNLQFPSNISSFEQPYFANLLACNWWQIMHHHHVWHLFCWTWKKPK